ncbi:hypothetical protein TCAL_14127 [Tigriopus californicus]|uniref:Sulfotransferase domain-containing protein n=1 Tax=Tigriopus californicus TaxID=6832 RepID=A0A553PGA8_TIGCA|nr:hypothetical protein TCAL_14127 [Tigriopus californicus]|eukprot:TCALIF_14127-PA protein Name:"Similar to CG9164 WSCD family member CG9164 (Drosophila melanogaster)" AED:0.18 eAED:0.18 QI:0/-1/0/1/-1/1/1/0/168
MASISVLKIVGQGPLSLQQPETVDWCHPLHLKSDVGPVVALASFPGSGNTWFRYLLQQASGIFTGSVYRNMKLRMNGYPGEGIANGSVSVIKTHKSTDLHLQGYDKVVLLVRDPSSAILAEFNRKAGGQVGYASPERFKENNGKQWRELVCKAGISWQTMNAAWISHF